MQVEPTCAGLSVREIDVIRHLTKEDGLSHFGATALLEDHKGLVWVGTFKGLNLFDGFEFKHFYKNQEGSDLTSNRITALHQDANNNVIIGTEEGVSVYIYNLQKFVRAFTNKDIKTDTPGPYITDLAEIGNYIVCNTLADGVYLLDKDNYSRVELYKPVVKSDINYRSRSMVSLDDRYFLLGSNYGLHLFDSETKTFEEVFQNDGRPWEGLAYDGEKLLFGLDNWSLNIVEIDWTDDKPTFELQKTIFGGDQFMSVYIDIANRLWLMRNNNSLAMVEIPASLLTSNYECIQYEFRDSFTRLSDVFISDEQGGWIASFNEGLMRFRVEERPFKYSSLKSSKIDINSSTQVMYIQPFDEHNALISFNSNSIKKLNVFTNQVDSLPQIKRDGLFFNRILKDNQNRLWLGNSRSSIYRSDQSYKLWEILKDPIISELYNEESCRAIAQDRYGDVWIMGTSQLYRVKLDVEGEIEKTEFLSILAGSSGSEFEIFNIYPDPIKDVIWIPTVSDGLIKLDYSKQEPVHTASTYQFLPSSKAASIPSYHITKVKRLSDESLWIGSVQGGLSSVIENGHKLQFQTFSGKNGLDDDDVMTFEEDDDGNLWVATNSGINFFDRQQKVFRSYSLEDGVTPASFEVASTTLKSGVMVFGGNKGACYFNPKDIQKEVKMPKLLFGDLIVFNERISVWDNQILDKPLDQIEEFELMYDQNSISIEVISLHYSNTKSHQIRYRLLPLDEKWVKTSSQNKLANFNSLPPGKYTFQATVSNNHQQWSDIREFVFTIRPPIWKSDIAYIVYTVVAILVVFVVMTFLIRLKNLSHKLEIEQIEKNRAIELDSARIKLFMNISHEFRTPLTLISGPITLLRKMFENNQDAFQHIDLIRRQTKKMYQLVEQVHDLRKADKNVLKLNMKSFDFTDFISDLKKDFEQLAKETSKQLTLEGEPNQLFVVADKQKLEVVVNNLLNNAFKFTSEHDTITIRYTVNESGLRIEVEDTGKGIKEEDQEHLFKRFYQARHGGDMSVGSGIGLELTKTIVELHFGEIEVVSSYGEGTCFVISLPVKVSRKDLMSRQIMEEILNEESEEDRQRMDPNSFDLSNLIIDESLKKTTIFYTEDNYDLRKFVEGVLGEYFSISSFSNGKNCLKAMGLEWPDIILSDIKMPEMNGLELCKNIKADIRTSHIPVILLTSLSSTDAKIEGLEMGADAYITKPFEMRHLIASIQNILQNRQKLRERFKVDFPMSLQKKKQGEGDNVFLEKLYGLMEENLANSEVDLDQFARELLMNRTHFYQKVKAITNKTPHEIFRSYRLQKAAELLKTGDYSIREICFMTGYTSRTYFSRIFKEQYGVNPSKYGKS